jgi:hypothetical protein
MYLTLHEKSFTSCCSTPERIVKSKDKCTVLSYSENVQMQAGLALC